MYAGFYETPPPQGTHLHSTFAYRDETISVRASGLLKVVHYESETTGSPEDPRREAVHVLAFILPFTAHPAVFLYLDEAPSSYEDCAPTHMPISGMPRQTFQPAERPQSALEDTRGEGGRWTFGCWGGYSQ